MNALPMTPSTRIKSALQEWWLIVLGLLGLYVPMYAALATDLWSTQDQAHGPIVLMVVLFLAWQKRDVILDKPLLGPSATASIVGWIIFIVGLLSYVLGRSQDILMFDIGSQILVFSAVLLITRGTHALKHMWFPLFFIFFMIPLPGFFLDAVTLPMKIAVSTVAEQILYWFDYPIARSGVVLQIGQYQLLVADACAGMHTLISLEALGLLYLNLVKHDSLFRNFALALLIIPISFTANVIRVIVLTLVTFYFGDEAGQGFIHGFAGMVLFVVALTLIMSVDSLLQYFSKRLEAGKSKPTIARVVG